MLSGHSAFLLSFGVIPNHWLQCSLGSSDPCPHTSMQTVHLLIHPLLVQEVSGESINSTASWPRHKGGCLHDQGHKPSGFLTPLYGPKETIPKGHSQKSAHFLGSGCPGPMAIWLHTLSHYEAKLTMLPASTRIPFSVDGKSAVLH